MVTLSFTIFSGQKNYNRAHMLFQVLCGFEPIFYTTHPNEEPEKETKYEFSKYPEDEFWIVSDVDDNLDNHKTEFEKAIQECEKKGYKYAISNPFFEIWLLLHHDEVSEEDRKYAVTKTHPYEATDHFRIRLTEKGAPLKDQKHLKFEHYSDEKIRLAVQRAKELVKGKEEKIPSDYGTYVYQIIEEILEAVELPVEELDNRI